MSQTPSVYIILKWGKYLCYFCRKTWEPGIWLFRLRIRLPRVKVTRVYLPRVKLPRVIVSIQLPRLRLPLTELHGVNLKLLTVRIRFPRVNLTWVDFNTWGKVTVCRVARGQFDQGMITQEKDKVIHGDYNLGRYKYPGKVNLGRIAWNNFNHGINTQCKDRVTQGKFTLCRYKYRVRSPMVGLPRVKLTRVLLPM